MNRNDYFLRSVSSLSSEKFNNSDKVTSSASASFAMVLIFELYPR